MIETFTIEEMIAEWKLRSGLSPLRTDGIVSRTDGIDIDSMLRAKILDWYARMLHEAPPDMLPLTDITSSCTIADVKCGVVTLVPPPDCSRITQVCLTDWQRDATIVSHDSGNPLLRLQLSPYSRGGAANPVAVSYPHQMLLYSTRLATPSVSRVSGVMAPVDGSIVIDRALFSTIPTSIYAT